MSKVFIGFCISCINIKYYFVVVRQAPLRSRTVSFVMVLLAMSIKGSRLTFLAFVRCCISVCLLNRTTTLVSASKKLLVEDGLIATVLKRSAVKQEFST